MVRPLPKYAVVILGKSLGTIVFYFSNKRKKMINKNSTKELAVIGTGDVLSGIIASLTGNNKLNV